MNSFMLLVCIVWFLVWKVIEAAISSICCAVCYKVTWMKWDQCSRLGLWAKCRVIVHLGKPQAPKSGHDQHLKFWSHETIYFNVFLLASLFCPFLSCPPLISFAQDFSNDDTRLEYNVDADNGIAMEGYLFKRASNAFKTWNRYKRLNKLLMIKLNF